MARIRTLKPEIWGDEKLAPLAPIHRLVFVGLISLADDAGRLLDNVKQLDGLLFPETPDSCADSLVVLDQIGLIERGRTAAGQQIIQIVGWKRHQKVDHPKLKACLPPIAKPDSGRSSRPTAAPADSREPVANESREGRDDGASGSRVDLQEIGDRVDLRPSTFDQHTSDQRASDPHARAHEEASPRVNGWTPTDADRELAAKLAVDCELEADAFRDYVLANGIEYEGPEAQSAHFRGWLRKAPGFNGNGTHAEPPSRATPPRFDPAYQPPPDPVADAMSAENEAQRRWYDEQPDGVQGLIDARAEAILATMRAGLGRSGAPALMRQAALQAAIRERFPGTDQQLAIAKGGKIPGAE